MEFKKHLFYIFFFYFFLHLYLNPVIVCVPVFFNFTFSAGWYGSNGIWKEHIFILSCWKFWIYYHPLKLKIDNLTWHWIICINCHTIISKFTTWQFLFKIVYVFFLGFNNQWFKRSLKHSLSSITFLNLVKDK